MYLLLSTIIYCVITQMLDMDYRLAVGIYLIGLGFVKGFWSQQLKDVPVFAQKSVVYRKPASSFGLLTSDREAVMEASALDRVCSFR